jgi:hypothetical protein
VKTYIGVKIIQAEPRPRGSDLSPGYEVHYPDGYSSWSPKKTFEQAYREVESGCMTFGLALEALKLGRRVARVGWNGRGMWLAYSPGMTHLSYEKFWASQNRNYAIELGGSATVLPCITMKTATGEILMGWLASQTDILAEDWVIVQ